MADFTKYLIGTSRQQVVSVRGDSQTVTLTRVSKSSWIAVGIYAGETIEKKGADGLSALSRWQQAARGLDR